MSEQTLLNRKEKDAETVPKQVHVLLFDPAMANNVGSCGIGNEETVVKHETSDFQDITEVGDDDAPGDEEFIKHNRARILLLMRVNSESVGRETHDNDDVKHNSVPVEMGGRAHGPG